MSTSLQRFLFLFILILVGAAGWWLGRKDPEPVVAISSGEKAAVGKIGRPALPAPDVPPLPATAPPPPDTTGKIEGPLARLMRDPEAALKLTAAQLNQYLAENRRNAASLLAAFRLSGDFSLMREAARKFPGNAAVQTELASRSTNDTERRNAIDAMRRADPANALGDHLSALDHLRHGRTEDAFNDLVIAAGKTYFDDYNLSAMQSAEEARMAAGFTAVEAKAAAMFGLQRQQLQPMRDLAKQLGSLQQGYTATGDAASVESIRQMGHALGRQMQSGACCLLDELVGISIEKQFLDPVTAAARLQEIEQRTGIIKQLTGGGDLLGGMSAQEAVTYFDRVKLFGEAAAMQWLRERHGLP